ncbi:hypothetical protein [Winogradskyella alexanderae]|uniref:Uncharacterized protein n=1 Tax=Winogradskyella alexanderae TaxID=2877123 RepID=A0ABS7XT38_9FLAO|nr:hypothetical protein [Winogradskyella alexanderae]MCA0133183.1 hypothetical protein [Winogradskyella alexanderae]
MKKIGPLVLGVIIGALAMYFYCNQTQSEMAKAQDIVKPKGVITPKEAKTLDQAYNLKHSIINDSLFKKSADGGDNRSSWWSIEDIKDYIKYADKQAGELGYTMDGLRVYLGSYPATPGEMAGLTTMFIVPTGKKNTSQGAVFALQPMSGDIPGGDPLNIGQSGQPPGANYPQ